MCGIAGFLLSPSTPDPAGLIRRMTDCMAHRGPDGSGTHVEHGVALGHRRLSIIDLAAGGQPMRGARGEWIVFNGEIYNYKELRERHEAHGYRFATSSDTEVILAAWEEKGEACLDDFIGMFAFAILDPERDALFLARDRFGKKPLFYLHAPAASGTEFAFASELKALLAHPHMRANASVSRRAVADYLANGYICAPDTIFEQTRKLPAGHWARLTLSTGELTLREYWDPAAAFLREKQPQTPQSADRLLELLDDAVRLRLRSDVPVGAFLSGGMDSSSIVSCMRRQSHGPIRAFCVSFDEAGFDESEHARRVARHVGVDLEVIAQPGGTDEQLARLVWHLDEPFCDNSIIPTYRISLAAKRFATVILSGDGADEILAGYPTCRADRAYPYYALLPGCAQRLLSAAADRFLRPSYGKVSMDYALRRFLRSAGMTRAQAHASWRRYFDRAELAALLSDDMRQSLGAHDPGRAYAAAFARVAGTDFLDQTLYADIKVWMQDDILVKVDRMSMAASLELRSPFLDHRLVEFLAGLPPRAKMDGSRQKAILKDAMRPHLPESILARKKAGFNHPTHVNAETGLRPSGPAEFFRPGYALKPEREDVTYKSFCLRVLGLWFRMFDHYRKTGEWSPAGEATA